MGIADEEGWDDTTSQHDYLVSLYAWRRRAPEYAAKMEAGGPPPPMRADGIAGLVWWYEYHPPTAEQYALFLDRAVSAEAISAEDRAEFASLTPIEGVAAVRARLAMAARTKRTQ